MDIDSTFYVIASEYCKQEYDKHLRLEAQAKLSNYKYYMSIASIILAKDKLMKGFIKMLGHEFKAELDVR
jgi:hypothetical protein